MSGLCSLRASGLVLGFVFLNYKLLKRSIVLPLDFDSDLVRHIRWFVRSFVWRKKITTRFGSRPAIDRTRLDAAIHLVNRVDGGPRKGALGSISLSHTLSGLDEDIVYRTLVVSQAAPNG